MRVLATLLLLLVSSCAGDHAAKPAAPALWRARTATSTVYLFGTFHLLPRPAPWFTPAVASAFHESRELWTETNMTSGMVAMMTFVSRAVAPAPYSLRAELGADTWSRVQPAFAECGLPAERAEHLYLWAADFMLMSCTGIRAMQRPTGGAPVTIDRKPDAALVALARKDGKALRYFETLDQSLDAFARLPPSVHLAILQKALNPGQSNPQAETQMDPEAMERAWLAGDVETLARYAQVVNRVGGSDLNRALLTKRNVVMADAITDMLQRPTVAFVAVGVGHFTGQDGVLALLEARGFHVERIE